MTPDQRKMMAALTPAQQTALLWPQRTPGKPPAACSSLERLRSGAKWNTTLTVDMLAPNVWAWHASVARSRNSGRPMIVESWKPRWIEEAHERIDALLKGVGDQQVPMKLPDGMLPGHLFAVHRVLLFSPWESRFFESPDSIPLI